MGNRKIVANSESSSPPEKCCRYGDQCYRKTFTSYPADHDCYHKTFPVGYRFKPTDFELISYYLTNKASGQPLLPDHIRQIEVYNSTPAEITEKYKALAGDGTEWYFFTDRERKYPNGVRPRRDTGTNSKGYWKATGNQDAIKDKQNRKIGSKRTLVYYEWKPKMDSATEESRESSEKKKQRRESTKTDFKMQEYILEDAAKTASATNMEHATDQDRSKGKAFTNLVLCKIYCNPGKAKRNSPNGSPPSEDNVTPTSRADDGDSFHEAFIDPPPFFEGDLPSPEENQLFERELIQENQKNNFFNGLPD